MAVGGTVVEVGRIVDVEVAVAGRAIAVLGGVAVDEVDKGVLVAVGEATTEVAVPVAVGGAGVEMAVGVLVEAAPWSARVARWFWWAAP